MEEIRAPSSEACDLQTHDAVQTKTVTSTSVTPLDLISDIKQNGYRKI